jgi:hypothetical protein
MKIKTFVFVILLSVFSCSSPTVGKIYWNGNLIKSVNEINYLSWKDGNQFTTKQQDSVVITLAGFELSNSIYFFVSITNLKNHPITFFNKESNLQYKFKNEDITLNPVRSKNMNKKHVSLFNTVIEGAGGISRLFFLNLPLDALFNVGKEESNSSGNISAEYLDEKINMSKKIFINNHTLLPATNYAGFLVYEYNEDKPIKKDHFILTIIASETFIFEGDFQE